MHCEEWPQSKVLWRQKEDIRKHGEKQLDRQLDWEHCLKWYWMKLDLEPIPSGGDRKVIMVTRWYEYNKATLQRNFEACIIWLVDLFLLPLPFFFFYFQFFIFYYLLIYLFFRSVLIVYLVLDGLCSHMKFSLCLFLFFIYFIFFYFFKYYQTTYLLCWIFYNFLFIFIYISCVVS